MIRPLRGKVLVEMLPASEHKNPLNLKLVDSRRHYDHASLRGKVISVGDGVRYILAGDIVVFRGDSGRTLDYDPTRSDQVDETKLRWLNEDEVLAVEDHEVFLVEHQTGLCRECGKKIITDKQKDICGECFLKVPA